ncbi:MAG: hypothetical protein WC788_08910 [Candidatus Paceibacterota bacterium]
MVKFEETVMSKIRSGKVRLRSRYIFIAEKFGLESAFALSVILSVLFSNLFFFYLKSTDNLEYLSFGSEGFYAFLESFPYLLVVAFIVFMLIAGHLLTKVDLSYKKPFKYFALGLIAFVFVSSGVLAYTDISEKIEEEAFNESPSSLVIKPFLKQGVDIRKTGVSGRIFEVSDGYFIVEMPSGFQKVDIGDVGSGEEQFVNGQFVIIIGERKEDTFVARRIRIAGEDKMQMIRRRIYINSDQSVVNVNSENVGFIMQGAELKRCMDNCLILIELRRECFDKCNHN